MVEEEGGVSLGIDEIKEFGLGVLHYTPDTLGRMMICDFVKAYVGHHKERLDLVKIEASITRTATTLLFNLQLPKGKWYTPQQLWPFSWEHGGNEEPTDKEEAAKKLAEDLATIRNWKKKKRSVKNGDGNKQS